MSRQTVARLLRVRPGADRWAWLRSHGRDAADVVLGLIDDAMRKDTVVRALDDEYRVDTLVRQRAAELRRGQAGETDAHVLMVQAERDVLGRLVRGRDALQRAAALRLRLWRRIERREFPPGKRKAARQQLQKLREARPSGWRVGRERAESERVSSRRTPPAARMPRADDGRA